MLTVENIISRGRIPSNRRSRPSAEESTQRATYKCSNLRRRQRVKDGGGRFYDTTGQQGMTEEQPEIKRHGVAVVIVREGKFLIIRRSQAVLAPGMCCFPGGGIEAGESEEEAVVREMQEELAVTVVPRKLLWRNVTTWGVALAWWLAELDEALEPVPNPEEVESCRWLTPGEMAQLPNLLPNNHEFLKALAEGVVELL